jgi:hypothetical protein
MRPRLGAKARRVGLWPHRSESRRPARSGGALRCRWAAHPATRVDTSKKVSGSRGRIFVRVEGFSARERPGPKMLADVTRSYPLRSDYRVAHAIPYF